MASESPDKLLLRQTITNVINSLASNGSDPDTIISVLSLACLFFILNRGQTLAANTSSSPPANEVAGGGIQKILGELTKNASGGGQPAPDALASLLPLLNSPQLKSKLTPGNIAAILGLVNSLGGMNSNNEKKAGKEAENNIPAAGADILSNQAATTTADFSQSLPVNPSNPENDSRPLGKSLNWKSNF